jgi:hypothetical protein
MIVMEGRRIFSDQPVSSFTQPFSRTAQIRVTMTMAAPAMVKL